MYVIKILSSQIVFQTYFLGMLRDILMKVQQCQLLVGHTVEYHMKNLLITMRSER